MDLPDLRPAWAVRNGCSVPTCDCTEPPHVEMLALFDAAWKTSRLCVWGQRDLIRIERQWGLGECAKAALTPELLQQGMATDAEQWWATPEARTSGHGGNVDETLACGACADGLFVVRMLRSTPRTPHLPTDEGLYLSVLWKGSLELALFWAVGETLEAWVGRLAPRLRRGGISPSVVLAMGTWVLGGLHARAAGQIHTLPVDDAHGPTWLCCDPGHLVTQKEPRH